MIDNIVYLSGKFVEKSDAFVSPFDRGFQYGDSVYEVIPIVKALPRSFDESWIRLKLSAASLSISLGLSKNTLYSILSEIIKLNKVDGGYLYIQVSRGISEARHKIEDYCSRTILIYTVSVDLIKQIRDRVPLSVITCEETRWSGREVKCTNLVPNVLAKEKAYREDASEAIFISSGEVNEGASSSIFFVKNGRIYSRKSDSNILKGIRAQLVKKIARDLNYEVVDCVFSIEDLLSADEIFLTSATLGVAPVGKVDGVFINQGLIGKHTKILRDEMIAWLSR